MIRLTVPCSLEYRDLALSLVASACKLVRPRRATDPLPGERDFDAEVVSGFGEAFTNVVLHGGSPPDAGLGVEIDTLPDRLTIRLLDHGRSFDPSAVPAPDLENPSESGYGVFIMNSMMDEVTYRGGGDAAPNVLQMTKRLGDFKRTDEGDRTVLKIEGVLDAVTVPNIRRTLDALIAEQRKNIVLEFSGLRLIDSSGVGVIVSLYKRARAYGGTVRVTGLTDQPLSIFKLLRLDRVFGIQR